MKFISTIIALGWLLTGFTQAGSLLESVLQQHISQKSERGDRWVFYSDKAAINRIEKPAVKAISTGYDFYSVTLTNYLGYHVNQVTCLALIDTVARKCMLVEPLWYAESNKELIKAYLGHQFDGKDSLMNFLSQLNELMETGSGFKFLQTSCTNDSVTYDLVSSAENSYTTGGYGTASRIGYDTKKIWRKITIEIKNYAVTRYVVTNPATDGKIIIE